jgi:hypothetical protein
VHVDDARHEMKPADIHGFASGLVDRAHGGYFFVPYTNVSLERWRAAAVDD